MMSTAIGIPLPQASASRPQGEAIDEVTSNTADKQNSRMPFLDFMRAIASQCIVLHHLVFYGPLPERAYAALPQIFDWFYDHARMAVQVFFVLGGFFTSRGLCRIKTASFGTFASTIITRYRRIGIPYLVTLLVAVMANELARVWMTHEAISERPTILQLLAHATFVHDILGFQALTAGIWYLAIDFQLFLLTLVTVMLARAVVREEKAIDPTATYQFVLKTILPLALASLFWFNRHPQYDVWAIYFVGAYYLGIVLHGVLERSLKLHWGAAYLSLVVLAGVVDLRPRLFVAAATAFVVFIAQRGKLLYAWPKNRIINYMGRISYSLFLIHFPVLLVVNAWGSKYLLASTASALAGLIAAYVLSLLAGIALYRGVESRIR